MKKLILIAAALALSAVSAMAEPYVGADANYHAIDGSGISSKTAFGYGAHLGWKYKDFLAAEVGYSSFLNQHNSGSGPSLDGFVYLPVDFPIKPFATAGVQYLRTKTQTVSIITNPLVGPNQPSLISSVSTTKGHEPDFRIGAGVEYSYARLTVRYQNMDFMNRSNGDVVTSLGFNFPLDF